MPDAHEHRSAAISTAGALLRPHGPDWRCSAPTPARTPVSPTGLRQGLTARRRRAAHGLETGVNRAEDRIGQAHLADDDSITAPVADRQTGKSIAATEWRGQLEREMLPPVVCELGVDAERPDRAHPGGFERQALIDGGPPGLGAEPRIAVGRPISDAHKSADRRLPPCGAIGPPANFEADGRTETGTQSRRNTRGKDEVLGSEWSQRNDRSS